MKNAKKSFLIDLLESFSTSEIERFTHFVASTYFNTDQWTVKLFKALKQNVIGIKPYDDKVQVKVYRITFSDISPTEEVLNKKQKKLLGVKMSVLTRLAKRFLTIEALEETPACEKELLNKKLLKKKQFRLFNRLYEQTKKQLQETQIRGIDYYNLAYQVEVSQLNFLHQKELLLKRDNFSELIGNLDVHYLLSKLKLHLTMLSIANVTKKEYDFTPIEGILPILNLPQYSKHPLIAMYQIVIQLTKYREEQTYRQLLNLLEKNNFNIPRSYLIDFYNVATNFCTYQIRIGEANYNNELFDFYKKMDAKDLFLEEGFMQASRLKNLVVLACRVNEFEWAIQIIHKYSSFIQKEIQKSVYHFNLGYIDFCRLQYKEATSHLIRVDKVSLAYDLDGRLLLAQSYYLMDTDYDERTMQIFRSTAHFVYTHKTMPANYKKSYKNFLQMLISLYQVRHGVGRKTIEGVRAKLSDMSVVLAKQWLLEQMKKIEEGNKRR